MNQSETIIETPDGPMTCSVTRPDGPGPFPAVIQFMDAGGLRDELRTMASRYAETGVVVITPDLFHRFGEGIGYDPKVAFAPGGDEHRAEMFATLGRLTDDMILTDATAVINHLAQDDSIADGPTGCVGYCLGGRAVVRTMAAFSDQMAAGSALHPSHLMNDNPDCAINDVPEIDGEMYFGFGGKDELTPPALIEAVREKLAAGEVENTIDITPDADHGFTMPGWPQRYNPAADALHWDRTLDLFKRRLVAA